jgi:hypothetical protein
MSAAPNVIDATRCPLCGGDNRCAIELERETGQAQAPCWCMSATFTAALRERIPLEARNLACICARCMTKALAKEPTP